MTNQNDAPPERRAPPRALPERLLRIHREMAERAKAEKLAKRRNQAAASARRQRAAAKFAANAMPPTEPQ